MAQRGAPYVLVCVLLAIVVTVVPTVAIEGAPGAPTTAAATFLGSETVTSCGVSIVWGAASTARRRSGSTWTKPVTHYHIYATGGGTTKKKVKTVQGASTTTTFITGLKAKTSYMFQVSAVNEVGEGDLTSFSAQATTQASRKYLFVSDYANDRVLRFDHATKLFKDVFVAKGSGGLKQPRGIAFNKYDDPSQPRTFYVASEGTESILQYDACDGSFVRKFASVPGEPRGIKFHTLPSKHTPPRSQKVLLVSSHYTNEILKFNAMTGSALGVYATGVQNPQEVIVGPVTSANNPGHAEDIFVTGGNAATQFTNITGAFRAKFTDKEVNSATGATFVPGPAPPPVPMYWSTTLGSTNYGSSVGPAFAGGVYSFKELVMTCPISSNFAYFREAMIAACAAHGMQVPCYVQTLAGTYGVNCIPMGNKKNIYHPQYLQQNIVNSNPNFIYYPTGWGAVNAKYNLANGYCAAGNWGTHKTLCVDGNGMQDRGCTTWAGGTHNKFLCAKAGGSAAAAVQEAGPGGFFMTGPFAGGSLVKFNMNNGTYEEHVEDRDLKEPTAMEYLDRVLYVLSGSTVRTYDAETMEFLEVYASKDGMSGMHMVFHDM